MSQTRYTVVSLSPSKRSKPFLIFSFFHILFVIKINRHLWQSDREVEWNMMYFELCSKHFFVSNKKVTVEKHYNVKLFLQFSTFITVFIWIRKDIFIKNQKIYLFTVSRFLKFGPFKNTHRCLLWVLLLV